MTNHAPIRVEVNTAPPKDLMTNHRHRTHWAVLGEATKALQWEAIRAMSDPPEQPVWYYDMDVTVIWSRDDYPSEKRFPDVDNLPPAVKPCVDMLQKQGYILDDKYCRRYSIAQELGDSGRIILEVTPR